VLADSFSGCFVNNDGNAELPRHALQSGSLIDHRTEHANFRLILRTDLARDGPTVGNSQSDRKAGE
jgi:hypothetical protein